MGSEHRPRHTATHAQPGTSTATGAGHQTPGAARHSPAAVCCAPTLTFTALPGLPELAEGADLPQAILDGLARAGLELCAHDVLVVTSKVVSRVEGRSVDLSSVQPGARALELAREVHADPRLVELVLSESAGVSRTRPGALVVRHRLGFVSANAGIDTSNVLPPRHAPQGSGPWVLLLPEDPDASARALRDRLAARCGVAAGVLISDSLGRPFRLGTVGTCIGAAGLPPLYDQRGRTDLSGHTLQHTISAPADQLAAAADLVAGQADEARPVILARGLSFVPSDAGAKALVRPAAEDLYR